MAVIIGMEMEVGGVVFPGVNRKVKWILKN